MLICLIDGLRMLRSIGYVLPGWTPAEARTSGNEWLFVVVAPSLASVVLLTSAVIFSPRGLTCFSCP